MISVFIMQLIITPGTKQVSIKGVDDKRQIAAVAVMKSVAVMPTFINCH